MHSVCGMGVPQLVWVNMKSVDSEDWTADHLEEAKPDHHQDTVFREKPLCGSDLKEFPPEQANVA